TRYILRNAEIYRRFCDILCRAARLPKNFAPLGFPCPQPLQFPWTFSLTRSPMKALLAFTLLAACCVAPLTVANEKPKGKDPTKVVEKLWPDDPAKPGNRAPGAKGDAYEDTPVVYLHQPKNPN